MAARLLWFMCRTLLKGAVYLPDLTSSYTIMLGERNFSQKPDIEEDLASRIK